MRRLHHMSITSAGAYYLVLMIFILTAALLRQLNLLMVLYGVLAGPLLLSWRLVRRQVKPIDVVRRAPKSVVVGEPFTVELELMNGRRRGGAFALTVADELLRSGRHRRDRRALACAAYCEYVPAGEVRRVGYRMCIEQRGIYDFQPLRLSSGFPFGLLRTMMRLDRPQRLAVLPRGGRLSPAWRRLLGADDPKASGFGGGRGFQEEDFFGMRDWRPGDPSGRIHWRTTARRGTLTVRQYERRSSTQWQLVVELWEPRRATAADRRRTEAVVSFAAALLTELCRSGGETIGLTIVARRVQPVRGVASSAFLHDALYLLAAAEPTTDDPSPERSAAVADELPRSTSIVFVGTRCVDPPRRSSAPDARAERCVRLSPDDPHWSTIFTEDRP